MDKEAQMSSCNALYLCCSMRQNYLLSFLARCFVLKGKVYAEDMNDIAVELTIMSLNRKQKMRSMSGEGGNQHI